MTPGILRQIKTRYKTWDRGKGKTGQLFVDLMSDDATFRSIGGGVEAMAFTRSYRTRKEISAYFEGLIRDWQMIFFNVRLFLVQGDTIAIVCECAWKQRHTGKTVHSPKLDIIRVKDGKMCDFFEYFDTHQAFAACVPGGDVTARKPRPLYKWGGSRTVSGVTSATTANVKTLKKLYAQWNKTKGGTADSYVHVLAPNVLWGSLTGGADPVTFTRTRLSREEVADYFRELDQAFRMNYYKVTDYIAAGPFVLVLADVSFTSRKTGKTFRSPKADLWRFARGKATEFYEYYDTAQAIAAAS
ncbi:nuclear transport factor 2 family protein [Taklimakanibacter lacteus]|uniref:nuclear transport factor 2 family protein n=1 Tax=Taklimakanibacter lacteus TaxID=2268456 RepID=UPI000E668F7D